MSAAYVALFRLFLPLLSGFAAMRLIVAPVAIAAPMEGIANWICTPQGAVPASAPRPGEDMMGGCPHMLRPRKTAILR